MKLFFRSASKGTSHWTYQLKNECFETLENLKKYDGVSLRKKKSIKFDQALCQEFSIASFILLFHCLLIISDFLLFATKEDTCVQQYN